MEEKELKLKIDILGKETRGTPIESESDPSFTDIGIFASQGASTWFFDNLKASKGSPYWDLGKAYYWSNSGDLTFYGYYPYASSSSNGVSVSIGDTGKPEIAYQVPKAVADQPDLMIAQTLANQNKQVVNMTFHHALSCIAFDMTSEDPQTVVKSIGITGIGTSATISMDFDGTDMQWTTPTAGTDTFYIGLSNNSEPIDDLSSIMAPNGYLMMIPQDIPADANIIVEFESVGTKTIPLSQGGLQKWEAGYKYTYRLKEGAYTFNVTVDPDTVIYTGGTYKFNINSYYNNSPAATTDLGWTVEVVSASTTYNWADDLSTLADATGGANVSKQVTCDLSEPDITSSNDFVEYMRNLTPVPQSDPVDLSEYSTGKYCSANCYIVDKPGWHQFPCWVMGNGLSSQSTTSENLPTALLNTNCYTSSMTDYKGDPISTLSDLIITTVKATAEVVWQTPFEMISDLSITDDGQYILFNIANDIIAPGNALIAIKDSTDTIMWSWHIWISPWSLVLYKNNGLPNFYGINIGTSFPQQYDFPLNKVTLKFTQNKSGLTKEVTLVQTTDTIRTGISATYYQWGRKDPMLPSDGNNNDSPSYPSTGVILFESGNPDAPKTITNPNTFYTGSGGFVPYAESWGIPYGTTGNYHKTIYDPSPIGSVVPSMDNSYKLSASTWVPKYPGLTFNYVAGTVVFMAIGNRSNLTGSVNSDSTEGYYWTNREYSTASTGSTFYGVEISQSGSISPGSNNNWKGYDPHSGFTVMPAVDMGFFSGE